ncbi:MAG: alanine racemase [Flavobacteriaceae bacterium]|nr:alanine racemase [Flavobacteriaceae bacterium]
MNTLYINLSHLEHNYHHIRSIIGSNVKLMGVVKANAYGGSDVEIAAHLQKIGVDYLAVATAQEGRQLRQNNIEVPILVFYPQFVNLETLFEFELEPSIYSFSLWDHLIEWTGRKKIKNHPIHLKFNTGMNRLGFELNQITELKEKLSNSVFDIRSIYSHLGYSQESSPFDLIDRQTEKFKKVVEKFTDHFTERPLFHLINTSGVFNRPDLTFDMVRCGIGLYGYANHSRWDQSLKSVMTLESKIMQIRHVKKGEYIGYDKAYRYEKDGRIAILPLGYADGISRHSGNQKNKVWINGHLAPIIGNVCMDLLMIDVTHIDCQEQDTVEFFGTHQSTSLFAENSGIISYEQLSNIGSRIKRKVIDHL